MATFCSWLRARRSLRGCKFGQKILRCEGNTANRFRVHLRESRPKNNRWGGNNCTNISPSPGRSPTSSKQIHVRTRHFTKNNVRPNCTWGRREAFIKRRSHSSRSWLINILTAKKGCDGRNGWNGNVVSNSIYFEWHDRILELDPFFSASFAHTKRGGTFNSKIKSWL